MTAPQGAGELIVDHRIEHEVLYVIVSRVPIAIADPRLAKALAAVKPADHLDCKATSEARIAAPAAHHSPQDTERTDRESAVKAPASLSSNLLRGTLVRKRPVPTNRGSDRHAPPIPRRQVATGVGSTETLQHVDPLGASVAESAPPGPGFERSPEGIVWYVADDADPGTAIAADAHGIAVVRYAFVHVAPNSTP